MKNEKYKRLYIKELYMNTDEPTIEKRLDELLSKWFNEQIKTHPNLEYRIINAETQMINASTWAGQTIPATIKYIMHLAYTI